jgi:hypothetical protein
MEVPVIVDDVEQRYLNVLGEPSRRASFRTDDRRVDVWKWDPSERTKFVTIYASIGASAHALHEDEPLHRVEVFAGLAPPNDDVASSLAAVALEPMRTNSPLGHGITVSYPDPLWPATEMRSFLVLHPRVALIESLRRPGGMHVEFLQIVPVHSSEVEHVVSHGVDSLLDMWEASRLMFWDPDRAPVPAPVRPFPSRAP